MFASIPWQKAGKPSVSGSFHIQKKDCLHKSNNKYNSRRGEPDSFKSDVKPRWAEEVQTAELAGNAGDWFPLE